MLADVGCNVPVLDEHDQRVIEETRAGTTTFKGSVSGIAGLPDKQDDVGGWDDYPEAHRAADWDTDHDGLPNAWETAARPQSQFGRGRLRRCQRRRRRRRFHESRRVPQQPHRQTMSHRLARLVTASACGRCDAAAIVRARRRS